MALECRKCGPLTSSEVDNFACKRCGRTVDWAPDETAKRESELPCPGCGRPMARVAGPDGSGWTCVNCNAAGDPEEDHLQDPADSRPCGCEETEGLKATLERVVALANRWERCEGAVARSFAHALQTAIEGEVEEPSRFSGEPPFDQPPRPPAKMGPIPRTTLLEHIADGLVDMLDGEPTGSDSLDWALEQYGYKPTKGVTEEQVVAEQAAAEPKPPDGWFADEDWPGKPKPSPEPWRVGTRIPEHVYIGDRPLVTMPTAELAALVVEAVNRARKETLGG